MRLFILLSFLGSMLSFSTPGFGQSEPKKGKERIVLHTSAGDILLALYPDLAPQTVQQVLKLVRLGVYDGIHFYRVEDNFVVQVSVAEDRAVPLTPEQKSAIHPIPAEFSPVPHRRGILSMARYDDPNSATTSFSILLGPAPHLDNKYTVFGEVERGMDAVDEIVRVPRVDGNRPSVRIELIKAEVLNTPAALAKYKFIPAHPVDTSHAVPPPQSVATTQTVNQGANVNDSTSGGQASQRFLIFALVFIVAISGVGFFLSTRISLQSLRCFLLLNVFLGTFFITMEALPLAQGSGFTSVALFLGMLGMIRLLGNFESPVNQPANQPSSQPMKKSGNKQAK